MSRSDQFKFEIVQNIAVLSTDKSGWSRELNLVSYNDAAPKYDIRSWDPQHEKMGKGITLTKDEIVKLKSVLDELL